MNNFLSGLVSYPERDGLNGRRFPMLEEAMVEFGVARKGIRQREAEALRKPGHPHRRRGQRVFWEE